MPSVLGFAGVGMMTTRTRIDNAIIHTKRTSIDKRNRRNSFQQRSPVSIAARPTENNEDTELSNDKDNFDGEGFANYLLPYAIALIGSIAATAAVFKFVLLDY